MFFPSKMDKVAFVLRRDDLNAVLDELARLGLVHPARVEDVDAWAVPLGQSDSAATADTYAKLRNRIAALMQAFAPHTPPVTKAPEHHARLATPQEIEGAVSPLEQEAMPVLAEFDALQRKEETLRILRTKGALLLSSGIPTLDLVRSDRLFCLVGVVDEHLLPDAERVIAHLPGLVLPLGHTPDGLLVCAVAPRGDRDRLVAALAAAEFRETLTSEALLDLDEDAVAARKRTSDRLAARLAALAEHAIPILRTQLRETDDALQVLRLRETCRFTEASCLLIGWAPHRKTPDLLEAVHNRTNGRAVMDAVAAEDLFETDGRPAVAPADVPVLMEHPRLLRPFDAILDTYGTPTYWMVDPTPFLALTFLVMFGIMFGDLGHGLVLMAIGGVVVFRYRTFGDLGRLLLYCGGSASVFGLLFGSVFGVETLLPTLWVKPLEDIQTLFAAGIALGVAMISAGIVMNTLNAIRSRAFARHFFESSGPLGGIAYWLGVTLALVMLLSPTSRPLVAGCLWALGTALGAFFLKGPVLKALGQQPKAFPEGAVSYVMQTTFEIADFLMGYLANTVSFIRVAAFGLAHAGLFVATFGLSEIVSTAPGGGLWSTLVLVFGNVLIIVLEGVVVTIQILRLEYYEFFGKFFHHYGTKYRPVGYREGFVE